MLNNSAGNLNESESFSKIQNFFKKNKRKDTSTFLNKILGNKNLGDLIFERLTLLFAVLVFLLVVLMGWEMYSHSILSIKKFGFGFLFSSTWDPYREIFGALPVIYGTLVSSFLALLIAVPLGISVAIFLSELAPSWIEKPLSFLTELLAGIPSVIYGLWGIFVLVPWLRDTIEPYLQNTFPNSPFFQGAPYGFGMLAGAIILSIMVLPIISSISRDILRSVPYTQREAAYALGATKWEVTKIVLGNAKSGLVGAIMLGLGRAIGETMAVTMVIGNRAQISASLLDPSYTMASAVANEFTEASSDMYLNALIELALVLFIISIIINILAHLLVWSTERKWK
ncbi:MAG TPA: phosphate ABC transporter permease subunit PstC [Ignavibacteriaceae bacterium]|nr:phosphate ABC transporter permease subunit PstC [Ignavibacteriaceae bacterium]